MFGRPTIPRPVFSRPAPRPAAAALRVAALALCAALPRPALADPSCAVRLLGGISVETSRGVPVVALSGNGKPLTLILDTGAERTTLTPAGAERIAAQPPRIGFDSRMRGIGGTLPTREVELRTFDAGPVALPWRRLLVASVTISRASPSLLDGLLGDDVLGDFDLDIDLPRRRLSFYKKRSCADAPPQWTGPVAGIAAGRSVDGHLFFPVLLDGRRFSAILDTGAQRSVVSAAAAQALGVGAAALGRDRPVAAYGATGEQLSSHVHRFSRLEVGGEAVAGPEMIVSDVALRDADVVLGADFAGARRVWMSYGSQRIFLGR